MVTRASVEVQDLIARSVLPSTRLQYVAADLAWKKFREETKGGLGDLYNCDGSTRSMVLLVLEWIVWMESKQGYPPLLIQKLMTGFAFYCKLNVVHAGVTEHKSIVGARKAAAPARLRVSGGRRILGVTLEMMSDLRELLWVKGTLDQKMTYIALATGYNFTLRPGHVTYMGPTVNDHRYLFGDVTVESDLDGTLLSAAEWLTSGVDVGTRVAVAVIILRIDSSKSHNARNGGDGSLNFISPGNDFETQYYEDFLEWLGIAGVLLNPRKRNRGVKEFPTAMERPLFSRVHPITRMFKMSIVKDLTGALKACGETYGFERSVFTGKSLRIGGTTTAVASGASSDDILRATGHAHVQTSQIYTRSTKHKATSFGYGDTVGMQDLKRMTVTRRKK